MKARSSVFFTLLMGILFISSCDIGGPNNEELKSLILEAEPNLKSYSYEEGRLVSRLNMHRRVIEFFDSRSKMNSKGDVDRINRKAHFESSINSGYYLIDIFEMIPEFKSVYESQGQYSFSNNSFQGYSDLLQGPDFSATWQTVESDWNDIDRVGRVVEIIKNSDITQIEDEEISGVAYYVINVSVDSLGILDFVFDRDLKGVGNLHNDIKNYYLKAWVNKETFFIEKVEIEVFADLESPITKQDFVDSDLGPLPLDYNVLESTSSLDFKISNINKEVSVSGTE